MTLHCRALLLCCTVCIYLFSTSCGLFPLERRRGAFVQTWDRKGSLLLFLVWSSRCACAVYSQIPHFAVWVPPLPPSLPFLEKLIPPFIKFNTDVHTPNKRRLGASERLRESQQEKRRRGAGGPPSGGLNCALNRSEAPPPCWRWQGMACLPAFVDRPKYALLCVRAYASKYMWFLAIFMLC